MQETNPDEVHHTDVTVKSAPSAQEDATVVSVLWSLFMFRQTLLSADIKKTLS